MVDASHNSVTSTVLSNQGKTLRITIPNSFQSESILLDNVARFNVFLFYVGTNPSPPPATEIYPQSEPFNNTPANYYYGGWKRSNNVPTSGQNNFFDLIYGGSNPTFNHLAFADITLTVLNDDGVALLNQINGSMPQGLTWEDFLAKYGRTYTQRVRFFNSP